MRSLSCHQESILIPAILLVTSREMGSKVNKTATTNHYFLVYIGHESVCCKSLVWNQPYIITLKGEEAALEYFVNNTFYANLFLFLLCQECFVLHSGLHSESSKSPEDTLLLFLTLNVICNIHLTFMSTTFVVLVYIPLIISVRHCFVSELDLSYL